MTKREFIDYIRTLLPRVDKTGRYHKEVVSYTIERAVNNVLCDMYLRSPESIDPYIKTYYDVEFEPNDNSGLWEAIIPVSYIPLPVVGSGVREVAATLDSQLTFVPLRYDDLMRTVDLTSNHLTSMIYYSVVDNRLIFSSQPSKNSDLRLRILTSFTDYKDDDNFIVPYGQDLAIVHNIREILGLIPPVDLYVNNSDYGRSRSIDNR